MVIGVGIDIVDIRRVDALLQKFGERFLRKIYTQQEIAFCQSRKSVVNSLAKMFALKESMIKALSDARGIRWHDMEVLHDKNGRPSMKLMGIALDSILRKSEIFHIHASASDETTYAIGYVVIEGVASFQQSVL